MVSRKFTFSVPALQLSIKPSNSASCKEQKLQETMRSSLLTLVLLLHVFQVCIEQGTADRTLQSEASGADVVRAVVKKVQSVFGDDHQFLRRVAFVESKDGRDRNTYRPGYHGGIWQVDEIGFDSTQDTRSHPGLVSKFERIKSAFGIDWRRVRWSDLRMPLYSGIAARLFLSNIPSAIPRDVRGQAKYWKDHYNSAAGAGSEQKFIRDVKALGQGEEELLLKYFVSMLQKLRSN